jgi:hypothetical protein
MEEDMKLAQCLQDEKNTATSNYPANRRRAAASRSTAPEKSSWWDILMAGMGVSSGLRKVERSEVLRLISVVHLALE